MPSPAAEHPRGVAVDRRVRGAQQHIGGPLTIARVFLHGNRIAPTTRRKSNY